MGFFLGNPKENPNLKPAQEEGCPFRRGSNIPSDDRRAIRAPDRNAQTAGKRGERPNKSVSRKPDISHPTTGRQWLGEGSTHVERYKGDIFLKMFISGGWVVVGPLSSDNGRVIRNIRLPTDYPIFRPP